MNIAFKHILTFLCTVSLVSCTANSSDNTDYSGIEVKTVSENSADSLTSNDDTASQISEQNSDSQIYDVTPIVTAYKSADTSSLSDFELEIYNKACEIINDVITNSMSDYEKELAVHDYIISNCTYDNGSLSAIANIDENSVNPYGTLINGKAICTGYTTTFLMFMEMFDIPCNIIYSSDDEGDEHAWNTILLDGSWYYVDVTWDDPIPDFDGRPVSHTYFNISREEIAVKHVLTDDSPETDSLENSFNNRSARKISTLNEIYPAVATAISSKTDSVIFVFDENLDISLDLADFNSGVYVGDNEMLAEEIDSLWNRLSEDNLVLSDGDIVASAVDTTLGIALKIRVIQFEETN